MRRLGLVLIIAGAVTTVGGMFLTRFNFGRVPGYQSLNTWEAFHGLDIAMAAGCGIAAGLAVAALLSRRGVLGRLAGIAGALLFGLTFAVVPDTIDEPKFTRAGLWVVAGTGAIGLVGAVLVAFSRPD
jgi:hypothetical protein